MAQLVNDSFDGVALTGQWATDHANGGSHTVGSGTVTLNITAVTDSQARIRTSAENMADGDALEVNLVSGGDFHTFVILRDNLGTAVYQPCLWVFSGNWNTAIMRDSTGATNYAAGPSIASRPRARMRRSGATLVCETYNGATWDSFGTLDATTGGGLWTPSFTTARAELLCRSFGGPAASSMVVTQLGDGTLPLVTDALRFVPGTVPDPIVANTPYTLEVEAIDTTQGNARVTTYGDPTITIGVDVSVPSGYVISAGDTTQPMTAGLATFPGIEFALDEVPSGAPTIASFAPGTGTPGDSIVITGTNYAVGTNFFLNATPLSVLSLSPASATVLLPGGISSGRFSVANGFGSGMATTDFIVPPPSYPTPTPRPAVGGRVRGRVFLPEPQTFRRRG